MSEIIYRGVINWNYKHPTNPALIYGIGKAEKSGGELHITFNDRQGNNMWCMELAPDKKGTVFIGPDRKITGWRFEGDE